MTPAQRKAEKAQHLINDPLLNEAVCAMRKACYDVIESSQLADRETREDYFMLLKVVMLFEGELKSYINRGKLDELNTSGEVKRLIK